MQNFERLPLYVKATCAFELAFVPRSHANLVDRIYILPHQFLYDFKLFNILFKFLYIFSEKIKLFIIVTLIYRKNLIVNFVY